MAVQIRMARHGTKKAPFYRIVVTDGRNARDGRFIERLGVFDPRAQGGIFQVNRERLDYWTSKGATASATVARLVKKMAKTVAA
jgi:small subunit ribosomal protein S16